MVRISLGAALVALLLLTGALPARADISAKAPQMHTPSLVKAIFMHSRMLTELAQRLSRPDRATDLTVRSPEFRLGDELAMSSSSTVRDS